MKLGKALWWTFWAALVAISFSGRPTQAKPEFAKKESKACTYCHVKLGDKELNDAGKYYKDHKLSLEGYKEKGTEAI